jgi:hypothetical protein
MHFGRVLPIGSPRFVAAAYLASRKNALKFDTIVVIEGLLATLFEKSKLF